MNKLQKILCFSALCGMLGCVSGAAAAESGAVIIDAQKGKHISVQQLAEAVGQYDVVFFGEFHDQDSLHQLEYDFLKSMYAKYGTKLVLSMEMFEADNQAILNRYLLGEISEQDFIANSRPWPNYTTDYRPLIEFAKAHKITVLAANVPRFLAAKMAKEGSLDNVEEQFKTYLPRNTYAPEGKYKEKFAAYMQNGKTPMRVSPAMLNQVFAAQCVKDDKMAESIFYYLEKHRDKIVLHINGCFHSDGHLGTVQKLEALNPALKTAVISPKDMPKDKNYQQAYNEDKKDGEYLIYFPRVNKEVQK